MGFEEWFGTGLGLAFVYLAGLLPGVGFIVLSVKYARAGEMWGALLLGFLAAVFLFGVGRFTAAAFVDPSSP